MAWAVVLLPVLIRVSVSRRFWPLVVWKSLGKCKAVNCNSFAIVRNVKYRRRKVAKDSLVFNPFSAPDGFFKRQEVMFYGARTRGPGIDPEGGKFVVCTYLDGGASVKTIAIKDYELIVTGHGDPGLPYVTDGLEWLPYDVVCDRLIEREFPKTYKGTITCDVCSSGLSKNGCPAFADLVFRYLRSEGYNYFSGTVGYMGYFQPMPGVVDGEKYKTSVVTIKSSIGDLHHDKGLEEFKMSLTRKISSSAAGAFTYFKGDPGAIPPYLKDLPQFRTKKDFDEWRLGEWLNNTPARWGVARSFKKAKLARSGEAAKSPPTGSV